MKTHMHAGYYDYVISFHEIISLTKSKQRAFTREDEDEGGQKLTQGGPHGVRVGGLFRAPKCIPTWSHSH